MNTPHTIHTLGQLKASGYQPKSIKDEIQSNLVQVLREGKHPFQGIFGYENSVIPAIERGLLAAHDLLLLGLRGQAKTRLARQMVGLLDEYIPVIEGSELNEDPMHPLLEASKTRIAELGDDLPISWVHRSERFFEKLATPDTSVADLIGDIDPIKAANNKLSFSDERAIHFGMIPRAHRCIFVINELPDLQPRLQVSLFNILQEGDIQIRGFQKRLELDLQFVFTANPEDYTNRGSIVTPLKDRIGSQIHTHYPKDVTTALKITAQETSDVQQRFPAVNVNTLANTLIEEIAFVARESAYIDAKSGVSARMTISAFETLLTSAERRRLILGAESTDVRLSDFYGCVPAIVGKVELVYEGEQEGAVSVAEALLGEALKKVYESAFPKFRNLKRTDEHNPFLALQEWFSTGGSIELLDEFSSNEYENALDIAPLNEFVEKHSTVTSVPSVFLKEMVLWALSEYNQINRARTALSTDFNDVFGNLLGRDRD